MIVTPRVDLNLGSACNANCKFCYYQKSLNDSKDLSTAKAKSWLKYFFAHGKRAIEFTGGEPTIRRDIIELIAYARNLGYKDIAIITNGIKMADRKFVNDLKYAGLTEVLFSVHGSCSNDHDYLTGTAGSFDSVLAAIANAMGAGLLCRSNTVVNGHNYKSLSEIADRIVGFGVRRLNFILFNPVVDAGSTVESVRILYSEAAPYLKKLIDEHSGRVDNITIRYMPFCFMPGYEKYITNLRMVQYDHYEWDYYLRTVFNYGILRADLSVILGCVLSIGDLVRTRHCLISKHDFIARALIFKNCKFIKACNKCDFWLKCDGLWKAYVDYFGTKEFK